MTQKVNWLFILIVFLFSVGFYILYRLLRNDYKKFLKTIVGKKCDDITGECHRNLKILMKMKIKIAILIILFIMMFLLQIAISFNERIHKIFIIIFLGAMLGSASKIFQNYKDDITGTIKCLFISLCSAAMLPLFLNIIQSNILLDLMSEKNINETSSKEHLFFTLFAFSVLTSIFADKVIQLLGDKYIQKIEKAEGDLKETKDDILKVKENLEGKVVELNKSLEEKDEIIRNLMKNTYVEQTEEYGEGELGEALDPNYEAGKVALRKGGN